jgi:hypothetical protein
LSQVAAAFVSKTLRSWRPGISGLRSALVEVLQVPGDSWQAFASGTPSPSGGHSNAGSDEEAWPCNHEGWLQLRAKRAQHSLP